MIEEKEAQEIQREFVSRMQNLLQEQVNRTVITDVVATGIGSLLNTYLAQTIGKRIAQPEKGSPPAPDDDDLRDIIKKPPEGECNEGS